MLGHILTNPHFVNTVNKFFLGCIILVTTALHTMGDTNEVATATTNIVRAAYWYRVVGGKVYNTSQSTLWKDHSARVSGVSSNGLLLQTFTVKPIYQQQWQMQSVNSGNFLDTHQELRPVQRKTGEEKVVGKKIFLFNYPASIPPGEGEEIHFKAMRVGNTNVGNSTIETWDCGTQNTAIVVTTNAPKRKVVSGSKVVTNLETNQGGINIPQEKLQKPVRSQ